MIDRRRLAQRVVAALNRLLRARNTSDDGERRRAMDWARIWLLADSRTSPRSLEESQCRRNRVPKN